MESFNNFVITVKKYSLVNIIAGLVIGLILLISPHKALHFICIIFGIALILPGLLWIYDGIKNKKGVPVIICGLIIVIAGIFIISKYDAIISIIGILFGIFLVLTGIINIVSAIKERKSGWIISALFGLATVAFGIICSVKANAVNDTIIRIYGISFLIYAASDLVSYIQIKSLIKAD